MQYILCEAVNDGSQVFALVMFAAISLFCFHEDEMFNSVAVFVLKATRQLRLMGVKTPIIALTGNALQSDRDLFFEAGVDDFQTKVFCIVMSFTECM